MSATSQHAAHLPPRPPVLVLASASPRRRELLWQLGVAHRVAAADLDEQAFEQEPAAACVQRLALAKAMQIWQGAIAPGAPGAPGALAEAPLPVLGADTAVVIDGEMLGKPRDREAAFALLARLSGRTHLVLTAVALIGPRGSAQRLSQSEVSMRALGGAEISAYWDSGEPRDKAGGYAIQGFGAAFVSDLRGSYSGVMGLPLFETAALLDGAGVPRGQLPARESPAHA